MEGNDEQPLNAPCPTEMERFDTSTEDKEEQPPKAELPMDSTESGIVTDSNLVQLEKTPLPILVIPSEMVIVLIPVPHGWRSLLPLSFILPVPLNDKFPCESKFHVTSLPYVPLKSAEESSESHNITKHPTAKTATAARAIRKIPEERRTRLTFSPPLSGSKVIIGYDVHLF